MKKSIYPYYEVICHPLWWNHKQQKWINEPLGGSSSHRRMKSATKAHNQARYYKGIVVKYYWNRKKKCRYYIEYNYELA